MTSFLPVGDAALSGRSPAATSILRVGAILVPLFLVMVIVAAVAYAWAAASLPDVGDLQERANAFRSTRIYDRDGALLNEAFDPDAGRRIPIALDDVSADIVAATVSTEDANFYEHTGVDPIAIVRAVWYALRERRVVSGASTIPQQLAKRLFLSPERTLRRKLKEVVLATEISRRYDKDEILELYLNEIYYGNLAYGVRAAADTYFEKEPSELTLAESALLAGLPQAPAYYDPYSRPERAKGRQEVVLGLMVEQGHINEAQARAALAEQLAYVPVHFDLEAPHFTLFVREQLEARYGPEALTSLGLEVTTTLDRGLQDEAERSVSEHVASLRDRSLEATNGALVAIVPESGEILALVGSADFNDAEIDGQVNMALAPRQPGSTMKPFAYLAALEGRGIVPWTPGTLLADIEIPFDDGANPPYVPRNYDEREHGLVTMRTALGNSYNIPAVHALDHIGVDQLVRTAQRLGITTLTRADYGLSLVLGAGEVPLVEMTSAFGVLANEGLRVQPTAIVRVLDAEGNVLCGAGDDEEACVDVDPDGLAPRERAIEAKDAFLISAMLSDAQARLPAFAGVLDSLSLADGRPAAVKTGTTNDYRDSLTIGYTPQLVTGVWIGNADRTPMGTVPGSIGAAPIWSRFMSAAHINTPVQEFRPPEGVALFEICDDTGTLPSEACPATRSAYFDVDRPPLSAEHDLWQRVKVIGDERAPEGAPDCLAEERDFKVYPEEHRAWALANGIAQPPESVAALRVADPVVRIARPRDGALVSGIVTVTGSADLPAFESWSLWYGEGVDPSTFFGPLLGPDDDPADDERLGRIDLRGFADGPYVLRLIARDRCGEEREVRRSVIVANPTATATPSPSPSPSATAAITVVATVMLPSSTPTLEPPKPTATGAPPTLAPRPTVEPITAVPPPTPTDVADVPVEPVPGVTAILPAPPTQEP